MSFPSVDTTTLTAVTPNLSVGQIADPSLRLNAFQYLFDKLTEIVGILNSTMAGSSGSENIGSPSIPGIPGNNIHAQVSFIETQIQNIQSGVVPAGTITTAMLADLAVTTAKMAELAITTAKLADGAVTFAKHDAVGQLAYLGGLKYAYKNSGGFL